MTDRPPDVPQFEVAGGATPEEIAALTVVLAAAAAARQDAVPAGQPAGAPGWTDRSRLLRSSLAHAPGGWRASARPR
jgi:Acyl-CoA carboxylase epsilon subunit